MKFKPCLTVGVVLTEGLEHCFDVGDLVIFKKYVSKDIKTFLMLKDVFYDVSNGEYFQYLSSSEVQWFSQL